MKASKKIFKFCITEFETWQPHTLGYINMLLYEEIKLFLNIICIYHFYFVILILF
jgi:hypothetical protein